jgi:ankyrin repeat protein
MGFTILHGLAAAGKYSQALDEIQFRTSLLAEKDQWGCSPIHYSAEKGHLVITNALLSAGADVNDRDRFSHTPLFLACRESQLETIETLIAQSADVNLRNAAGSTPLHAAASSSRAHETVSLLLKACADLSAVDGFENTALHICAKRGDVDAVRLLASEGSDLRAPNLFGSSPLDLAPNDSMRALMTEARKHFKRSGSGLGSETRPS